MRFKILGDKVKIKVFLDEFIELAKEEYDAQVGKLKSTPLPFGIQVPNLPFEMGYVEEGDAVVFYNTLSFPFALKLIKKRIVKKMEENLRGFFDAKGVKVEVKFVGD